VQGADAQGTFTGLHHRDQGAIGAVSGLPGAVRGEAQGGGDLLYSSAR
jgi:hypothetical protein